ncbi:MAG: TlyA family RNA methyltransferase [Nitrospinae bacterium]|nr:TlyA family RNA methyltransferase [Nitrospinota bacterium]
MKKTRLDNLLIEQGKADSREKAKRLVLSGAVMVGDRVVDKPGTMISSGAEIRVTQKDPFVSRGGLKLQEALDRFGIDCRDVTAIDIGASTGGFTDCLLQRGARKVFAVDVGYGQLDWSLRNDPRVVLLEKKNARYLLPEDIGNERVKLAVADVSFISLKLVLPPLRNLLDPEEGIAIALIKPQFEAGKGKVGKGGIVKDPETIKTVLSGLLEWFKKEGWGVGGLIPSPIKGQKGNTEFLVYLKSGRSGKDWEIVPHNWPAASDK